MSKINFYDFVKHEKTINPNYEQHGISVPFRMLISAPSGAGKTNIMMNLLIHMNKTFHEIILCCKTADEPLYEHLLNKLGDSVVLYENGTVPPLSDFANYDEKTKRYKRIDKYQRLIIFDDLVNDKKANNVIRQYYIQGRKCGLSMVYISQSFFQIPKMIRENCQYFILGRNLLRRDLREILKCFPTDMDTDQFSQFYKEQTSEPMDTMLINIEKRIIRRNIIGDPIKL